MGAEWSCILWFVYWPVILWTHEGRMFTSQPTVSYLAIALSRACWCHMSWPETAITKSPLTNKLESFIKRVSSKHSTAWQLMTWSTQRTLEICFHRPGIVSGVWAACLISGTSTAVKAVYLVSGRTSLSRECGTLGRFNLYPMSSGATVANIVLRIAHVNVPKHWMIGYTCLYFEKFSNIIAGEFPFPFLRDDVSLISPFLP